MAAETRHDVRDVFTPTTPARLAFVERTPVNNKLVSALRTPGKQVVVYGYSGSGKTTLLENKLHQTYTRHLTTRCVTGLSFEQLILDAFDQLGGYYESERTGIEKTSLSSAVGVQYATIKAQVKAQSDSEEQRKTQRILPPQLTPQTLARLLGEAGCCWVLEDFHKMSNTEKVKLAQVMKVFMDMADAYKGLKIIAIGAVGSARQVVEADAEMKNRVSEIYVPLMSDEEMGEIIQKGQDLLNFSMNTKVEKGLVRYSNGLASVCHQLCLNACFAAGITETSDEHRRITGAVMKEAVEAYLEDASDTLKAAFSKAFKRKRKGGKFDNGKLILEALVRSDQDGATHGDILANIRRKEPHYPAGNLTHYLRELQSEERGAVLRYDAPSSKYSFSDPIYRAFAMTSFEKERLAKGNDHGWSIRWEDFEKTLQTSFTEQIYTIILTEGQPARKFYLGDTK